MNRLDLGNLPLNLGNICNVVAGSIVYPPGGHFGPRIQQDLQLVLLYTGNMTVTIDGEPFSVQPGHVVILRPGHQEEFSFAKEEETWHRWIAIHVQDLSEEATNFLKQLPNVLPLTEDINRLTDLILSVQTHTKADEPLLCSLGLAALQLYPMVSIRNTRLKEKHPSVFKSITWMREHYSEELTLDDLAEHSGVSPEHLVRLFRNDVNITPIRYLWNYRVERAIELLIHTGLTVTEITDRCGFKTTHHFARLIKQTTGLTPTQIRQTWWKGLRTL